MARVAVVCGGRSLEREISLRSGHHVSDALRHLGHDVTEVDVDEQLSRALSESDAAFIALHGRDGEDGTIQLICESIGLPYTGSPPLTCHLCFDKGLAKGVLERGGHPTPGGYVLSAEAVRRMGAGLALRRAAERLGYPIVVKPSAQGSALGLVVVAASEELSSAVMAAFNYGDRVILERFVQGAELSVTLLGPDLEALPPVEIKTPSGVFDFQARVSPGVADNFLCPASVPAETSEAAQRIAREAGSLLGVRDFARVDIRVGHDGPIVLDLKTCPGLTESSLVPMAAAAAGVDFEDFISRILDASLTRSASVS